MLSVEDNRDCAESLLLTRGAKGAGAFLTVDGLEGVRPGLDGYEVCRRLRAALGAAALLAHTAGGAPERARDAGFERLLSKSIEPTQQAAARTIVTEGPVVQAAETRRGVRRALRAEV